MKARGIQNAINRLKGARRLGSAFLLAQAEQEALHSLTQAKAWLGRTSSEGRDENYTAIESAAGELERALARQAD